MKNTRRLAILIWMSASLAGATMMASCDHPPCKPAPLLRLESGVYAGGPGCYGSEERLSEDPFCRTESLQTLRIDLDKRVAILRYESGGHVYEEVWRIRRQDEDAAAFDDISAVDAAAPSDSDASADVGPDP